MKKLNAQLGGAEQGGAGAGLANIVPPEQFLELQNSITGLESKMESLQRDLEK